MRRVQTRRTNPRARQEPQFAAVIEGEHSAPARNDVDDEVGMLPGLKLGGADIDWSATDMTEQNVGIPDDEFVSGVTHRRRPIAATARLMKQNRAVLLDDFLDEPERCRGRRNLVFQEPPP